VRVPRTLAALTAAAAATIALVSSTPGPAQAAVYPTAYNLRTQELSWFPDGPDAHTTKSIYLTTGCYEWELWYAGFIPFYQYIWLTAGTYTWDDTLHPDVWSYDQWSTLRTGTLPMATSQSIVDDPPSVTSPVSWGSALTWQGLTCDLPG
jgi:hypothetical protein